MWERFSNIPWVLRIACAATIVLGFFQLLAIIFPAISPNLNGVILTSLHLQIFMAAIHIALGWGIYARKKWSMLLLITLPFFQYGVLFLETSLPEIGELTTEITFSAIWIMFFIGYYFLSSAKVYFSAENLA